MWFTWCLLVASIYCAASTQLPDKVHSSLVKLSARPPASYDSDESGDAFISQQSSSTVRSGSSNISLNGFGDNTGHSKQSYSSKTISTTIEIDDDSDDSHFDESDDSMDKVVCTTSTITSSSSLTGGMSDFDLLSGRAINGENLSEIIEDNMEVLSDIGMPSEDIDLSAVSDQISITQMEDILEEITDTSDIMTTSQIEEALEANNLLDSNLLPPTKNTPSIPNKFPLMSGVIPPSIQSNMPGPLHPKPLIPSGSLDLTNNLEKLQLQEDIISGINLKNKHPQMIPSYDTKITTNIINDMISSNIKPEYTPLMESSISSQSDMNYISENIPTIVRPNQPDILPSVLPPIQPPPGYIPSKSSVNAIPKPDILPPTMNQYNKWKNLFQNSGIPPYNTPIPPMKTHIPDYLSPPSTPIIPSAKKPYPPYPIQTPKIHPTGYIPHRSNANTISKPDILPLMINQYNKSTLPHIPKQLSPPPTQILPSTEKLYPSHPPYSSPMPPKPKGIPPYGGYRSSPKEYPLPPQVRKPYLPSIISESLTDLEYLQTPSQIPKFPPQYPQFMSGPNVPTMPKSSYYAIPEFQHTLDYLNSRNFGSSGLPYPYSITPKLPYDQLDIFDSRNDNYLFGLSSSNPYSKSTNLTPFTNPDYLNTITRYPHRTLDSSIDTNLYGPNMGINSQYPPFINSFSYPHRNSKLIPIPTDQIRYLPDTVIPSSGYPQTRASTGLPRPRKLTPIEQPGYLPDTVIPSGFPRSRASTGFPQNYMPGTSGFPKPRIPIPTVQSGYTSKPRIPIPMEQPGHTTGFIPPSSSPMPRMPIPTNRPRHTPGIIPSSNPIPRTPISMDYPPTTIPSDYPITSKELKYKPRPIIPSGFPKPKMSIPVKQLGSPQGGIDFPTPIHSPGTFPGEYPQPSYLRGIYPQDISSLIDMYPQQYATFDAILICASPANLITAKELSDAGKKVLITGPFSPLQSYSMYFRPKFLTESEYTIRASIDIPGAFHSKSFFIPKGIGGLAGIGFNSWDYGTAQNKQEWGRLSSAWSWPKLAKLYDRVELTSGKIDAEGIVPIMKNLPTTKTIENISAALLEQGLSDLGPEYMPRDHPGSILLPMIAESGTTGPQMAPFTDEVFEDMINPENVFISPNTHLESIDIVGDTVIGVTLKTPSGQIHTIMAQDEVILGPSPEINALLLYKAGFGDETILNRMNIPVRRHLPAVGKYWTAMPLFCGSFFTFPPGTLSEVDTSDIEALQCLQEKYRIQPGIILDQFKAFLSILDSNSNVMINFFAFTSSMIQRLDALMEGLFQFDETTRIYVRNLLQINDLLFALPQLMDAKSQGKVIFEDISDLQLPPRLDSGMYTNARDMQVMLEALQFVESLGETVIFQTLGATYMQIPIDACMVYRSMTAYNECIIRNLSVPSLYSSGGTVMGHDPLSSVVNSNLQVHGMSNLYVSGSGVIPFQTGADGIATSCLIGEYLANYILQKNIIIQ